MGGGQWILHHDNAPAHSALIVHEFLARNSITVLEHPPYSPDLAPCDFFLFPKCKLVLRGHHLWDVTIKSETTSLLKGLREEEFQGCFHQWKRRWNKCIASNGEHFEGDHIDESASSSSSDTEPPIGGFGLLNDILPLCCILDTG